MTLRKPKWNSIWKEWDVKLGNQIVGFKSKKRAFEVFKEVKRKLKRK